MRTISRCIIVLITAICGSCVNAQEDSEDIQRQKFDLVMSEKIEQLYAQAKDWKTPTKLDIQDDRLEGDYKHLSEFLLKYWIDNVESRNQYLRELDLAKWDEFLDIRRLESDKKNKYKNTEKMFSEVKLIRSNYEERYDQVYVKALQDLEALELNAHLKEQMKEKLIHSREHNDEQAVFKLELEIMKKAEQMFEFIKKNPWTRRNQTFMFKKDSEVKEFNAMYKDLLNFQIEIENLKIKNAEVFEEQQTARQVAETKDEDTNTAKSNQNEVDLVEMKEKTIEKTAQDETELKNAESNEVEPSNTVKQVSEQKE